MAMLSRIVTIRVTQSQMPAETELGKISKFYIQDCHKIYIIHFHLGIMILKFPKNPSNLDTIVDINQRIIKKL